MSNLASYLAKSSLTQADFAEAIGVSQPTVNRWLKGARPSWEKAAEIEKVTGGLVPVSAWVVHSRSPSQGGSTGSLACQSDLVNGEAVCKGAGE